MNKSMMIALAAVVVIALAGLGVYMAFGQSKSKAGQGATPAGGSMVEGTIQSLLSGGKNVTCGIAYTDGSGSGTIYVNGKSFRGDFNMTSNGKTYVNHMISDGSTAYVWADGSTQGSKMSITAAQNTSASAGSQTSAKTTDLNSKMNMKCSAWNVDNSKLTPPATVTFTDITAMLKSAVSPSGGSTGTKVNASYCAAITDPQAKAACESAVSDN